MNEREKLLEKLKRIEALHTRAGTEGERDAALGAREKLQARLLSLDKEESIEEKRFSIPEPSSRQLFIALCRRYGLQPYRWRGQRRTTLMLKVPQQFFDEVLWPEFVELDELLGESLQKITDDLISTIHHDTSDAAEIKGLPEK